MNKDLIILLQNSMAHATQIHLHNTKGTIAPKDVIATAFEIAEALWGAANSQEEQTTTTRQPGQRR